MICNKLFPTLYQVFLNEDTPYLSPEGQEIVKSYGDWYMTQFGVYIKISGSTKLPHWLPHFVLDSLLLQEISYQTFVNVVVASLHRNNKGLWPQFPLIKPVFKIEKFEQARKEVNLLSSYKFK